MKSGRSNRARVASSACFTIVGAARNRPKPFHPVSANSIFSSRSRDSTVRWSAGSTPSPPKPTGKCTHAEPEVVLRAAERESVGGVVVPDQLFGERCDLLGISHMG